MAPIRLKTRVPFVKRRVTRSYATGKVDFLPQLPEELLHMILKYLPNKDLENCLWVSKTWFSLINIDRLWKQRCLAYGIQPQEDNSFICDQKSKLCEWVQLWRSFRISPAYGWRFRSWKTLEVNRMDLYTKNASDGNSLVFCNGPFMTMRKAVSLGKTKHTLKLPFHSDQSCSVAVDKKYVAVAKGNMLLIYELVKQRYKCTLVLAINGDVITKTHSSTRQFIKKYFRQKAPCISIFAFSHSCIWLREQGCYKAFILNLQTEKITKVEQHFYRYIARTCIVSWSPLKLRVDDFLGKNVLTLGLEIFKARANTSILVTFRFRVRVIVEQVMETWDLATGERILCIERPKDSFFEIHPTKNILYQIEAEKNNITAICALSGANLWTTHIPLVTDILDWCMRVVCDRYLVVFQFKSSEQTTLHVIDAQSGQYLYNTSRPPGHLDHISDNLIISKTPDRIYVRTYLTNPYLPPEECK